MRERAELRLLDSRTLRRVYRERMREDFPPQERRPLASLERLKREGRYDAWGVFEGEALLAYTFLWRAKDTGCALLDYLGVCRERRGQGVGSRTLELLMERYGGSACLLAEVEALEEDLPAEELALRRRRLAFYQRAGFWLLGYQARLFGVRYSMLAWTAGSAPEEAALMAAHRSLYEEHIPAPAFHRVIQIPVPEQGPACTETGGTCPARTKRSCDE